jgi:adenylate cyclase
LVVAGTGIAALAAGHVSEGRHKREVSRAFGQYLSPEVIRVLMRHPESLRLGGETRDITVYFSDIQGFSGFSEGMAPADLVAFLNEYLTIMTDAILDRSGVIDKYEGDAIMAMWGAPLELPAHAREACLAVLDQQRALVQLNRRMQAIGRPALVFRAGIHSGPAVVGNMGSSRRFSYTAMGDTVNLASRLEGANKYFGTRVMLSAATRAAAGDAIEARRIGRIRVVGKNVATEVFELLGPAGSLAPAERERLDRYHAALAAFERGQRAEAEALWTELDAQQDPIVARYLEKLRAERLAVNTARWDGVFQLESKG